MLLLLLCCRSPGCFWGYGFYFRKKLYSITQKIDRVTKKPDTNLFRVSQKLEHKTALWLCQCHSSNSKVKIKYRQNWIVSLFCMNITGLRKTFLFSFFSEIGSSIEKLSNRQHLSREKTWRDDFSCQRLHGTSEYRSSYSLFLAGEIYHESFVPLLIAAFCKFFLHLD